MNKVIIALLICFSLGSVTAAAQQVDKAKINATLKEVYQLDQKYRGELDSLIRNKSGDYESLVRVSILMNEQDEENRKVTFPIIDTIIQYNIKDLDSLSYTAAYLVIQHSPGEAQAKYSEFVETLYRDDHITTINYMWFVDRLNERFLKKQKYGLQASSTGGTIFLFPISDRYRQNWEELGMKFTGSHWDGIEVPPVFLSDNQFAIIGVIMDSSNSGEEGVRAEIDEQNYVYTDDKGYFQFIVDKDSMPESVQIITKDKIFKYVLEYTDGTKMGRDGSDFYIIQHMDE